MRLYEGYGGEENAETPCSHWAQLTKFIFNNNEFQDNNRSHTPNYAILSMRPFRTSKGTCL